MSELRHVSMKMDPEVYEWVKGEAKRRHTTVTAIIHEALVDRIEAEKVFESMGGKAFVREALRKQLATVEEEEK